MWQDWMTSPALSKSLMSMSPFVMYWLGQFAANSINSGVKEEPPPSGGHSGLSVYTRTSRTVIFTPVSLFQVFPSGGSGT